MSLLAYIHENFFAYGFAGGGSLGQSFDRPLVELDRNIRVLERAHKKGNTRESYKTAVEKTIFFFSTEDGYRKFDILVQSSPLKISNINPKVLCDRKLKGEWSKYAKVWRYLLEDSYFDYESDHSFFMF